MEAQQTYYLSFTPKVQVPQSRFPQQYISGFNQLWHQLYFEDSVHWMPLFIAWVEELKQRRDMDNLTFTDADLQVLTCCREGGIGGNCIKTNRQIRYTTKCEPRDYNPHAYKFHGREEIGFLAMPSTDGTEIWTPTELTHCCKAFCTLLDKKNIVCNYKISLHLTDSIN
tara:strand:- start:116 stop:622 length:507 start_codon:yes stop_codon:yes gene_type:complete